MKNSNVHIITGKERLAPGASHSDSNENATIHSLTALEILDSRGNPTVEATILLKNGISATGIAPSGASTGKQEAIEVRDEDPNRFHGKGVLKACYNIDTEISPILSGMPIADIKAIDAALIQLDGTHNKSRIGANAIIAVSIAAAKAGAITQGLPLFQFLRDQFPHKSQSSIYKLPAPMMNIINGGAHASNGLAIQEFMIMPVSASSFAEAIRMGSEIFHTLKQQLKNSKMGTSVGDEGGFAPNFTTTEEALDSICESIEKSGFKLGKDIILALDCAASEFYRDKKYHIDKRILDTESLISYYIDLCKNYPVFSIEDAFAEDDFEGFKKLTFHIGNTIQIVGDDLFCTNKNLLERGVQDNLANALLVKFNQVGTLSETIEAINFAYKNNYKCIISHRSGESEDVTLAHLAVASNAGQIKTGSLSRTDRTCKYNELIRIEKYLGKNASYAGKEINFTF